MPRKRRTFTAEYKDEAVKQVTERGLTIAAAARDLGVGESTLGRWVQEAQAQGPDPALTWSEREELARLRRENKRLREEKEILKNSRSLLRSGDQVSTWRFIDAEKSNDTVVRLCSALCVSRAAWYAWKRATTSERAAETLQLEVHLRAAHRESRGTYGAPRLTQELRAKGLKVTRKRVARLMRKHNLAGVPRRPFRVTTHSSDTENISPNLVNREFSAERPNQTWVADITYVRARTGWLYVAVVIDLYARRVVGWEAAQHLRTDLPLAALRKAVRLRQPAEGLIHHSDRGCQYGSFAYVNELKAHGIIASMSRARDC